MIPYSSINADSEAFSFKGGRKPMWGCGLKRMEPRAMREGWELYTAFVGANPGAKMSFTAVECYSWHKAREVADEESAFPWRTEVDFWV
jgi:hypothetical protein